MLSSASSIKSNTVISRNQLHYDQAFEAAEAGIEYGLANLKKNRLTIIADTDGDGKISDTPLKVYNGNNTSFSIVYSNETINDFDTIKLTVT